MPAFATWTEFVGVMADLYTQFGMAGLIGVAAAGGLVGLVAVKLVRSFK